MTTVRSSTAIRLGVALIAALAQATPTTPPFVPSPTPGDPVDAFDAVTARFEASTLTPLTGQPFTLTLIVALPASLTIVEWPQIADAWGAFNIRDAGEVMRIQNGSGTEVRQSFTAVLWRPEDAVTPETFVSYGAGGGDSRVIPVRELFFSVPTVLDLDDENLRPQRPPLFAAWPWPWLILAAGGVTLAGYWFWSRRPQPEPEPPPTPIEIALSALRGAAKREPDARVQSALDVLRVLYAVAPHETVAAAIVTGEALAYTGRGVSVADADTYLELAARAVREISHA